MAASRHTRDTAEAPAATEDPMKALNALFESAKATVGSLLTKENLDKAVAGVSEFGEKVKDISADALKALQKTTDDLAAKKE